jgi:hypothetical protein
LSLIVTIAFYILCFITEPGIIPRNYEFHNDSDNLNENLNPNLQMQNNENLENTEIKPRIYT